MIKSLLIVTGEAGSHPGGVATFTKALTQHLSGNHPWTCQTFTRLGESDFRHPHIKDLGKDYKQDHILSSNINL